jgi:prefoldin subunit 5
MYAMGQLVYAFKHLKDKVDLLDQDVESLKKADDLKDQQIKELQKKVLILENALLERQKEEYRESTIIL